MRLQYEQTKEIVYTDFIKILSNTEGSIRSSNGMEDLLNRGKRACTHFRRQETDGLHEGFLLLYTLKDSIEFDLRRAENEKLIMEVQYIHGSYCWCRLTKRKTC